MERPLVGVAVFVKNKDGKIVLHKRKNSLGDGYWSLPGGHLELGETVAMCAYREVLEETGLRIDNIREVYPIQNSFYYKENKQYITLYCTAVIHEKSNKDPIIMEYDKCSAIGWFDIDNLPDPIWRPLREYFGRIDYDLSKLIHDDLPSEYANNRRFPIADSA